jgi:hypothetical protein
VAVLVYGVENGEPKLATVIDRRYSGGRGLK